MTEEEKNFLIDKFNKDLHELSVKIEEDLGHPTKTFRLNCARSGGGYNTAKNLLKTPYCDSRGYEFLLSQNRLNYSMEQLILDKYKALFTEREIEICEARTKMSGK